MENLSIEPTKSSPRINFDAANNLLEMSGESFPENVAGFYSPIFSWIKSYLSTLGTERMVLKMEIRYFNSSSSKVLMDMLELLDEHVEEGKTIEVFWHVHAENDMGIDYGEEFQEGVEFLPFHIVVND